MCHLYVPQSVRIYYTPLGPGGPGRPIPGRPGSPLAPGRPGNPGCPGWPGLPVQIRNQSVKLTHKLLFYMHSELWSLCV